VRLRVSERRDPVEQGPAFGRVELPGIGERGRRSPAVATGERARTRDLPVDPLRCAIEYELGWDGVRHGRDLPQFDAAAGRSSKFAVTTPVALTVTDCVVVCMRGAHATALYVPGGTFAMTYLPSAPTLPK
jgi:hypothetical protein